MGYNAIDDVIGAWADDHGLRIQKEYKDIEVRSVEYRVNRREGYQIWIDELDAGGMIGVHVWDFKQANRGGRRRDFLVSPSDLREYLEAALRIATNWLEQTK